MKAMLRVEVDFVPNDPERARQGMEQAMARLREHFQMLNGAVMKEPLDVNLHRSTTVPAYGHLNYRESVG